MITTELPIRTERPEAPVAPRHSWTRELGWCGLAVLLVVAVYGLVYARNGRFFYWDDMQHAYTGMSSAIGRRLREGDWPLDFRESWIYAMLPSDPQFALFHPVQLLLHAFVSTQEDLARTAFLVATFYAVVTASGTYAAARAASCRPVFAAGAAVAVALNLHTLYFLAPSWQTHAAGVAWFSWFLAALLLVRRRPDLGPLAIVPTYLFLTSGYPHAAASGVVVAAVLLGRDLLRRARTRREWVPLLSGLGAGAVLGSLPWLLALSYLPYIERPAGTRIRNDGLFTVHAESLLLSFSPFDRPFMLMFGDRAAFADQPITYVVWTIPAAIVLWLVLRRRTAALLDLILAAAALTLLMIGPEVLGPIRWPFRFTPFAAMLAVLAVTAVLDAACRPGALEPLSAMRKRVLIIAGVVTVILAWALRPDPAVLLGTAFVLGVATPAVVWLARNHRSTVLGLLVIGGSVLAVAGVAIGNERVTELPDWGGSALRSDVDQDVRALHGGRAMVLLQGELINPDDPRPSTLFQQLPSGQYPLISELVEEDITAGHAATAHRALRRAFCVGEYGWVCPDAPRLLFTAEPETGLAPADLMDVDRLVVERGAILDTFLAVDPPDWEQTDEDERWVLFERRRPSPAPSETVSWASDGVTVTPSDDGDTVEAPDGGRITLSRPWVPGLQVRIDGDTIAADAIAGVYPVVDLPAGTDGQLEVYYRLPRLRLLIVAVVVGLGLALASLITARRLRREPVGTG